MNDNVNLTFKICFLGDSAVGKTSLIRKYVFDIFDDSYLMTMGTKITKKDVTIEMPKYNKTFNITFLIWDIIGDIHFRRLLHHSYLYGAAGALCVCDVTRPQTLENLDFWINSLQEEGDRGVPAILLANKSDIIEKRNFNEENLETLSKRNKSPWLLTSAKTGANVEKAFRILGRRIIDNFMRNT